MGQFYSTKNLESLKGTFYTTALHVKHLSTEHCIAALIWGNFTPLGYYTLIEEFSYSYKSLPIIANALPIHHLHYPDASGACKNSP